MLSNRRQTAAVLPYVIEKGARSMSLSSCRRPIGVLPSVNEKKKIVSQLSSRRRLAAPKAWSLEQPCTAGSLEQMITSF